jgi:hypothetical protein
MGMQSHQQQVVDFLRENPKSSGAEIAAGLAKYGKSQNSIDLLIKALRTKGLCKMTGRPGIEWRYELTELCKANGFCSVLPDKTVTVSVNRMAPVPEGMALVKKPSVYCPYTPDSWESVRPGADDHKQHQSMGALSHFKERS